jgi:amino acid transporter
MSGLDIFAIIVLLILLFAVVSIWVALAMLPGKIAARRNHPQAEAINIGGWLGAILGGIIWPIFLIWAFVKPVRITITSEEVQELRERVAVLEASQGGRSS